MGNKGWDILRSGIWLLLFGLILSCHSSEEFTGRPAPPPPPPSENRLQQDTQLFIAVHPELQVWIGDCDTFESPTEKDSCEYAVIRQFILEQMGEEISRLRNKVVLEYVVEKDGRLGWVRIGEETAEPLADAVKTAFEAIRETRMYWCCPSARLPAVRILKRIELQW